MRWGGLLRGLLLALAVLAPPAAAQTVPLPLRSGEHATFTRFTLPLPADVGWQLGRTDGGYGLRLSDTQLRIDDAVAFARIPRTRVAAVRTSPGALELALGCACHANAFVEAGLLVIDIRDGPPPPGARFETRLGGPVASAPPVRPAFDWIRAHIDPLAPAAVPPTPGDAALGDESPLDLQDIARTLLLQQFARAASQGLIGVDLSALAPQPAAPAAADRAAAPAPAPDPGPSDPLRNLRIDAETALDRASRGLLRPGLRPDGGDCLPDAMFDFAAWADGRAPAQQIAATRRVLLGEFDTPDPAVVLELAQLYLHFGFGAEARAVLAALPVDLPVAGVLADLARLIDEALPLPGARFAGMEGCDGAVALWAVLAAPAQQLDPSTDRAALVRSFSALPPQLRRHLGPPLVQRLLAVRDAETAQQVRNAMGRAPGGDGIALDLVDAGLAMARGAPEEASRTLAPAAAGNAPGTPEALVALVEARQAAGLPIDAATAGNVAALAREHRGTLLGARLGRLEALELASAAQFDAAFAIRDRLRRDGQEDAASALAPELLQRLVEGADAEGFLMRVLSESFWQAGALPPQTRAALVERLLDLGFAELALDALPPPEAASAADRLLLARAALAAADPRTALRSVAGLEGPQADRLRGSALLALGDYPAAVAAFGAAEEPEAALRAAWLGSDWETAARLAEGATAQVAERRSGLSHVPDAPAAPGDDDPGELPLARADPSAGPAERLAPDPEPGQPIPPRSGAEPGTAPEDPIPGELAAARALIDVSAGTRALLAELLADHGLPDAP